MDELVHKNCRKYKLKKLFNLSEKKKKKMETPKPRTVYVFSGRFCRLRFGSAARKKKGLCVSGNIARAPKSDPST